MNRGNVPGYYYDEEKKKYFKIQANHLVPQGAKYGKQNLKREKRSTKKRKVEHDKQLRRERETITQAPVLKSAALGGIGLEREQGTYPKTSRLLMQYESATVSQWIPERVEIKLPNSSSGEVRLRDAHYIPEREQMLLASSHPYTGASILSACQWEWEALSDQRDIKVPESIDLSGLYIVAVFSSGISSISTRTHGDTAHVFACAEKNQLGNVYMGLLPNELPDEVNSAGIYLTLGSGGSSLGDSAIHPTSGNAAVIGSCGMSIIDPGANVVNSRRKTSDRTDWPRCEPCINWLDTNTVLYGAKPHHGYSVMLWDVRTPDGRAPRFNIRERLTGVFNPTKYGSHGLGDEHQILASTNHRINLYDTRMPEAKISIKGQTAPLISFSHTHGGPRLQRAAHGTLVAAVDADNVVQVYSIQTGTKVRSLTAPEWKPKRLESPILRQLMWYDDIRSGPTLQAVRGNGVVRWAWHGGRDEED